MKKLSILTFVLICLSYVYAFTQSKTDSLYAQKITNIEFKVWEIKNLAKDNNQKYYAILSDVENRKNILKSLLRTPPANRNKTWEDSWDGNYNKVMSKLDNIKIK